MSNTIFDLEEFKPFAGEWRARQAQFARCRRYYDGSIYDDLAARLGWLAPRLSGKVRPLYLPLARAVNLDAGLVPAGWELAEWSGAFQPAVDQVLGWSEWVTQGVLFVRNGALLGHSGLKVSDLRRDGRIVISPISPERFMLAGAGDYEREPGMAIVVELRRDAQNKEYEYAEVITPHYVRTFADGQPTGFGGRLSEYPNELGFVPFVEVRHIETGLLFGESTFETVTTLLDGVNELATDLGNIIRRHAAPQWAITGTTESDLHRGDEKIWYLPPGGDAKAMVAPIDIAGVLDFIREARDSVYSGLPELAFDELRKKDTVATATVELQLKELTIKISLVRPNYDEGFVHALRMAGRAAATLGLRDLAALDDDLLALEAARPVIPLDPLTVAQIELLQSQTVRNSVGGSNVGHSSIPGVG